MSIMDVNAIMAILPHRYPFLLVDKIVECDKQKRIVGIKNLTFNEPFFQGHFPGRPVMPGVLQLEAMAQTAGVLLNQFSHHEGQIAYYLSIDNVRFRRILQPGDQMRIEVELTKMRLSMARFRCRILCDGDVCSEAEIMLGAGRNDQPAS